MPLEHSVIKQMVAEGIDDTAEARAASEKCRDYYDGRGQWTEAEKTILRNRKQPVITHNLLRRKVDAMVGLEQRGRTDPVAYPKNPGPQSEATADVATKALRFVEETQRVDVKASEVFYNLCIEGYGGAEVIAEATDDGGMDVVVNRIRWEEIVYDKHSREKDFSDASYTGILKWMTVDKAKAYVQQFTEGKSKDEIEELDSYLDVGAGDTYDDRPNNTATGMQWYDKKLRRVRLAQIYYFCDGQWYMAILTGRGEIVNKVSPWLDHKKKPHNPMILGSAYVDRENRRYGFLVEDILSLQDEVNKRRSKMLHHANVRQTSGTKGATPSVAKLKEELAKPDGHVEIDPAYVVEGVQPFQVLPSNDQIQWQAQLLANATAAIDNIGPNAALMGQMGNQASGRAMMAAQQAGMAELAPIYDSKRDWTERLYRAIWCRIKQVWTGPKWIRVTGENEAPQFIGINMPVPMVDQMGQPVIDPMTMQPATQVQNPIAEMDVDILIEQAPDYATLEAEQFEKLAEMVQSGLPIPPMVLIEASSLHNKKKLLDMMQQQSAPPPPDPITQEMVQADIDVKKTQAMRNEAAARKDIASIPGAQAQAMASAQKTQVDTESTAIDNTKQKVMLANGVIQ